MTHQPSGLFIDPRFASIYSQHPFVLVDVGARGGLRSNWAAVQPHLRLIGFEPERSEHGRLARADTRDGQTFFDVALSDRRGPVRLHVARDRGLTSLFEPNHAFLASFPEADRFETTDVLEIEADALDNLLESSAIRDVDFIKADTQGSERLVLDGAARTLAATVVGVEVEVEFAPIYKDQPLFADVDARLRDRGFQLFDLRPVYWKRAAGRLVGGPRGQIVWADALYLKTLPALRALVAALDPAERRAKVLKTLSICLLYGYADYALEIARDAAFDLTAEERAAIDAGIRRRAGDVSTSTFPGQRQLAALFRRLARLCEPRDDAWSISGANLGNVR